MTKENAIKKLKKEGYNIEELSPMVYVADKPNQRDYIKLMIQNGRVIIIDLKIKGQEDELITDYHAGMFCRNLSQALRMIN